MVGKVQALVKQLTFARGWRVMHTETLCDTLKALHASSYQPRQTTAHEHTRVLWVACVLVRNLLAFSLKYVLSVTSELRSQILSGLQLVCTL